MIFQNFIHLFDPFILFILEEYRQESFEILLSSLLKPAIYLKTFSFFLFFFRFWQQVIVLHVLWKMSVLGQSNWVLMTIEEAKPASKESKSRESSCIQAMEKEDHSDLMLPWLNWKHLLDWLTESKCLAFPKRVSIQQLARIVILPV